MQKQLDITIILDRSGSMSVLQKETVTGINVFLKGQDQTSRVSLHQFDHYPDKLSIETTFKDAPVKGTRLKPAQYLPRGTTPLLDAVGQIVSEMKKGGDKVVVIATDGYENASREWTRTKVRELIAKKQKAGWQFVFMGAGIDAYHEASTIGITPDSTYAYASTRLSTQGAWSNLSTGTRGYGAGMTSSVIMPDVDTADPTYTPPLVKTP